MLEVTYQYGLIAASLAVAMMAGFTGFSLMHGASAMALDKRKRVTAYAAIALGGGIWSMHFVAMLGMRLPVDFYYDTLTTLFSALAAILFVGFALLVLHFRPRTAGSKILAGAIVGAGILVMHYSGMSGIRRCLPVYTANGVILAVAGSLILSIIAVQVAYRERTRRNIILGTVIFGLAVFAVHFVAMAGTGFVAVEYAGSGATVIGNETLALVVTFGSFLICGAFLLNSFTYSPVEDVMSAGSGLKDAGQPDPAPSEVPQDEERTEETQLAPGQIPFEKNGRIHFVPAREVAALRAEGHYTFVYTRDEKLFCPWSVSEAAKRLVPESFIRTHRSFLVNPAHVSSFERKKDNGTCYFEDFRSLEKVPVSRSRLAEVKRALGL